MPSIFHTEAPEKVRQLPDAAPAKSHHGEGARGIACLMLFFALLALLVWGCYDVFRDPQSHYPLYTVNVEEPQAPAQGSQSSQTGLQAVTKLAANNGTFGADVPGAHTVVANSGDNSLRNQEFIYYYWDSFYALYNQMGSYLTSYLNFQTPFDQQQATETQTWHQYLSAMAVESWHQTTILVEEADRNGYVLDAEAEAYLTESMAALNNYALQAGFADVDSYVCQMFDPSSDAESYLAYNRQAIFASGYAQQMYDKFYEDVYDPNAPVQYCVNVRHILLQPGEGEEMSAVLTRAEELLQQWQADPTEDNFAALAGEHTTDPGSQQTGGLYEDVYPGQMVTNFNDWCFDESRKVGDTGIVETEYGYHIMFFSGNSETVYSDANEELAAAAYTAWLDELFAQRGFDDLTANAVFTEKPPVSK